MLIAMYYLQDSVTRLKNIAATIEKDVQKEESKLMFETVHGNAIQAFIDYKSAITDLNWLLYSPNVELRVAMSMIQIGERNLLGADSFDVLAEVIEPLVKNFDDFGQEYNRVDIRNCYSDKINAFERSVFDGGYLAEIGNSIKTMSRPIKILNTYANDGLNMLTLSDMYPGEKELYAVDVDGHIESSNKSLFHRIALGDLKRAIITNDAFDVVMVAPPISYEKTGKNVIEKLERDYLQKSMNYLAPGGLMMYSIPVTHLYREICSYLAKNLTNIKIHIIDRNVHITGFRNTEKDREVNQEANIALRTLILHLDDDKYRLSEGVEAIELPVSTIPVSLFRGCRLDENEFTNMFDKSMATASFWKTQEVEKLSEKAEAPLLPFSVGQLGLILTSGCLDGVIDEGNGFQHVVKGRVVKKCDKQQNISATNNSIDFTEVTSNRVEINTFLPDGTYKCLA